MVINGKSLLWFRNDLRVDDNPALEAALKNGCTDAIFIRTPKQWLQHHMAEIKIEFIDRHIQMLKLQLQALNIKLTVLTVDNYLQQIGWLIDIFKTNSLNAVYANSELELNELLRDQRLVAEGVNLQLFESDTILPKGSITNKDGAMYKVFTPYKKVWLQQALLQPILPLPPSRISIDVYVESNLNDYPKSKKWPLADIKMLELINHFFITKLDNYQHHRDFPSIKGTSGLSPYLAIGAISVRRVFNLLTQTLLTEENGLDKLYADTWLSELVWREFYRNLFYFKPELIKGMAFKEQYQQLPWPEHNHLFNAWTEGKTGFPIIDAAIRQLKNTGWMHNRLRMIVASFLTKNCLVNWRLGEDFFMQHLIDGDFAANNGGWQWSSGTGCDAQPYFRVFNPVSQSKKFDPDGEFIRKYLPQLKNVPSKHIHQPYEYLQSINQSDVYWPEIVDLKRTRQQAIEFYRTTAPKG